MSRTTTSICLDAEIKEMAISKHINISRTTEAALLAELEICDKNLETPEKKIEKLKQKVRKMAELLRKNVRNERVLLAKIARFEQEKQANLNRLYILKDSDKSDKNMETPKTPLEIKNTPAIWNKLSNDEKKRINNQITANQITPKVDRSDIERRKEKYKQQNAERIAEAKRHTEERIKREEQEAKERADKLKALTQG